MPPARPPEGGASQVPERAEPANRNPPLPGEGGWGEGSMPPANRNHSLPWEGDWVKVQS